MKIVKESCRDHALTNTEIEMFKTACLLSGASKRDKYMSMYYLMGVFGLRIGEYCHFNRSWVIIDKYGFKIPVSQKCDCAECIKERNGIWSPKTRAGSRFIPGSIDPVAFEFVVRHYTKLSTGGYPPNRFTAYDRTKNLAWRAKIPHRVYPHSLRATAAMMIAGLPNANAAQLQAIMGWESLETANHYIRASGIDVERAFPINEADMKSLKRTQEEVYMEKLPEEERRKVEMILADAKNATGLRDRGTGSKKCDICDNDVEVKNGRWVCHNCGATNSID